MALQRDSLFWNASSCDGNDSGFLDLTIECSVVNMRIIAQAYENNVGAWKLCEK